MTDKMQALVDQVMEYAMTHPGAGYTLQYWRPIDTAPKEPTFTTDGHTYGPYLLAFDGHEVRRMRWWQGGKYKNWLGDCGNAFRPTHWMPLPPPPTEETK